MKTVSKTGYSRVHGEHMEWRDILSLAGVVCASIGCLLQILHFGEQKKKDHLIEVSERRSEWNRFSEYNYCVYSDARNIKNLLVRYREDDEDTMEAVKCNLWRCYENYSLVRGRWIKFDADQTAFKNSFVRHVRRLNRIGSALDQYANLLNQGAAPALGSLLSGVSMFVAAWHELEVDAAKQMDVKLNELRTEAEKQHLGV